MAAAINRGDNTETPFGDLMTWTTQIKEDGIIVIKSPCVGFSNPPCYEYMILETGVKFTSSSPNATQAYWEWKRLG